MDKVRHGEAEGEHNERAAGNGCPRHGPTDFDSLLMARDAGFVAGDDNSSLPVLKVEDASSPSSAPANTAPRRSDSKTKKPRQSKKSAGEEYQDEVDIASFALLKTHGDEVGLHDGRGVEARNRLICAAAATAADPSFGPERYFKANGLRFDKRTLASPLLGLIRMGLPKSLRKLASKWAEGGAEALRTVDDAAALGVVLEETGIEKFVRLARRRKRNDRVARGEAEPAAPRSLGLMLLGAPETLNGRVTVTLDLHDGVANFVEVVAGPADDGSPSHRDAVAEQPAAAGNEAGPVIHGTYTLAAETRTSHVQETAGHSSDGNLGSELRLSRDAPVDLPPTRTIELASGVDGQAPSGKGVQPPA